MFDFNYNERLLKKLMSCQRSFMLMFIEIEKKHFDKL